MAQSSNVPTSSPSADFSSMASVMGSASPAKLTHVVIILQRRPKHRDRGFIRAYAPDLLSCGIDQVTFLAFIDRLNEAVAAHPIISAFNLAGPAVGVVPMSVTPIAGAVGLGVRVVAGVVKEMTARSSQNSYLKKMNDELFHPHGLYCLVMAYDIRSRNDVVQFDLGTEHDTAEGYASPPAQVKSGILYLMTVNMPSDEDMNQSQNFLGAEVMQRGEEGAKQEGR